MTKLFLALAVLGGLFSSAAYAGPVTDEEKQFCAHDYRQYCDQDGLGSNLLRDCMRQHWKELSDQCIKALEDAGEVTKEEEAELEKRGKWSPLSLRHVAKAQGWGESVLYEVHRVHGSGGGVENSNYNANEASSLHSWIESDGIWPWG